MNTEQHQDQAELPVFLRATWRHLLMVNYTVDPAVLKPHVPEGTQLDLWNGAAYASLVGFRFLDTRVKGIAIPFHTDFEEINLRFYVTRHTGREVRRGVVFIKEIVPKPAIAWIARWLYHENYVALPTRHTIDLHRAPSVRYEWRHRGAWQALAAVGQGAAEPLREGTEEQFIADHYWGYSRQPGGGTKEYQVTHPSWSIWRCAGAQVEVDVAGLYGPAFAADLARPPTSVFIADGSDITVSAGRRIA